MERNQLIISPKTKVLQLIEAYPQLEDILISYVPAFKKLKNPLLKKTVAKIATLQQAATIGNVKVEDLINLLRKEVGQEGIAITGTASYNTQKPEWFNTDSIVQHIDIREMLNAGEQPVNQVFSDLNQLKSNEILEVIAPFIPAPLIDKATSINCRHWVDQKEVELFYVYFTK
jgi:hypothetical protein